MTRCVVSYHILLFQNCCLNSFFTSRTVCPRLTLALSSPCQEIMDIINSFHGGAVDMEEVEEGAEEGAEEGENGEGIQEAAEEGKNEEAMF